MDTNADEVKRQPDLARPGLAPPHPVDSESEQLLSVGRERFRVRLRRRHGPLYEYDYDWLTGPNDGYGFGVRPVRAATTITKLGSGTSSQISTP